MRKSLLVGLALTVAAMLVVFVSSWLDLELEPVVLLGVALGAVLALVPDHSPLMRLVGFIGGFVVAWVGYLLRAGVFPDSAGGKAVFVGLVMVLAVAIAAASFDRIPLWSPLLGVATLVGAYEASYTAAPPEVTSTSVSAATAVLFTVAVGFLVTGLAAPSGRAPVERSHRSPQTPQDDETTRLDDMMMEKNS